MSAQNKEAQPIVAGSPALKVQRTRAELSSNERDCRRFADHAVWPMEVQLQDGMRMNNSVYFGQFADEDNQQWEATLLLDDGQPTVRLVRENSNRIDKYHLTQVLNVGTRFDRFIIADPEPTDSVNTFGASATARMPKRLLLACATPLNGHIEIRWALNDPRVPF